MSAEYELDPGPFNCSLGKVPVVETQLKAPKSSLKIVWESVIGYVLFLESNRANQKATNLKLYSNSHNARFHCWGPRGEGT